MTMHTRKPIILTLLIALFGSTLLAAPTGRLIKRKAGITLTPVQLDHGDTLKFTLLNGQTRTLTVLETSANVIITNLSVLKTEQKTGATLYHFTCKVAVDGHVFTMERYVGSQESFYEPYVVNGMRIWFDGVAKMTDVVIDQHGGVISESRPARAARFAVTDITNRICPGELFPLYDNPENVIRIEDSYNGDDCWMGAYNGFEAHGGLDINQTRGSFNYTPFSIEDHFFFTSLAKGDNNNRWRGIHTWPNGDVWSIQNHHMLNLLYPEHTPIAAGARYAESAGVHVGVNNHSHYVFRARTKEDTVDILLDPWIIYWQVFEDNRARSREVKAAMAPLTPGKTNAPVSFSSKWSMAGLNRRKLACYWTFGDGGASMEENPVHTFVKPGIYPVTLVVDDGAEKSSFTQHITIDGQNAAGAALALTADEPSFTIRKPGVMDAYGLPVRFIPQSLFFLARPASPKPEPKVIQLKNIGNGSLATARQPQIAYRQGSGWLAVDASTANSNQQVAVSVNATGLATGMYTAMVTVEVPGVANGRQQFLVEMTVPTYPAAGDETQDKDHEIIDNADFRYHRFYSTPYFWVAPRFKRWPNKGYNDFYLTNGGRATAGEYARFRPDLEAGKYSVSFASQTPFDPQQRAMSGAEKLPVNATFNPEPKFAVRIHSKGGDKTIWVNPARNALIGEFEFSEGMDGFVDILSEGSQGQVLVDAILFKKL